MLDYESAKHIGPHRVVSTGGFGLGYIEMTIKHTAPDGMVTTVHLEKMHLASNDDSLFQMAEEEPEAIPGSLVLTRPMDQSMRIVVQGRVFGDENGQVFTAEVDYPAEEGERDG